MIVAPTEEISIFSVSSTIGKEFGLKNIKLHPEKSDGQYKKAVTRYSRNTFMILNSHLEKGIKETCMHFIKIIVMLENNIFNIYHGRSTKL